MEHLKDKSLDLVHVQCCVCESNDTEPVGIGKDFEYNSSSDTFLAMRCNSCGLVYLNPRPAISGFEKIYPVNYHAFNFSEKQFGIVYRIRSGLEAKRLMSCCKGLPADARILDVGCGDGFHLKLLRQYGNKSWKVEGIDFDKRAVEMAKKSGLNVYHGSVESIELPQNTYDLAFMIQTIEHVEKPDEVLRGIRKLLKPGGKLVIVTDNTDSLDFRFFKRSYWGGYHFPRHWNLFNRKSLTRLAKKTNFEVAVLGTQYSPVNWVYTIHNWLVDKKGPYWLINRFTLKSAISLSVFTILDIVLQKFRKGALLRAILRKPL
jgi:2-polyprenyl-3-methyl-5-hydroxy-6-metoxy-1,4-benzoquinol methylase